MSNKRKINKLAKKYNVNVHYIDNYWKILPPLKTRRELLLEHSSSKVMYGHPHFVSYWASVEMLFQKANKKDCYLFRTYNVGVRGFYQIN